MPRDVATKVGVQIGRDYPTPIVEHKAARERALAAFKQARATFADTQEVIDVNDTES